MPRFVILAHDWPIPHWDLMLEQECKLLTWRLLEEPQLGSRIRAEKSADHRLEYLDYSGPVSGGRGVVSRWDRGLLLSLKVYDHEIFAEFQSHRLGGTVSVTIAERHVDFHSELGKG